MSGSINTNLGAMVALRNLQTTNDALGSTQKRISTGLKVADAYDDGASYAVAQGLRSDISALGAVNERLAVGKGMIDVAVKSGENISKTMESVRNVLVKMSDQTLTGEARKNYETEYAALKKDIKGFIDGANYNGVNLIKENTPVTDQKIIASVDGGSTVDVAAHDLTTDVHDALTAAAGADDAAKAAWAKGLLAATGGFSTGLDKLNAAMNTLGADSRRISNQINFNSAIADATNTGLGAIVDADLAKESAKLQSLQTKQQLGVQALGIANQAPQSLLGLFR